MIGELLDQLALELIPGVGSKGIRQLISYCGSASQVFKSTKSKLIKIPGVGEKMASAVLSTYPAKEAESILSSIENLKARAIHFTHTDFPKRLKQIPDGPNIIYVKGNGDLNPKRSVAIIGTRKATEYGKKVTDQMVEDLSKMGVTVVSGLAYGIDIQAHKAAIKHSIPTFGVIAGGLGKIYPAAHKKYTEEMLKNGGLISENIPSTESSPHLFPARNRIIAGLTDAVIVVESAKKGGALITSDQADSYNRLVFAVPGNIGNKYSLGTNRLIASQKALIYNGVDDLVFQLGWDIEVGPKKDPPLPPLSKEEEVIYSLLRKKEGIEIDLIAIQSQLTINQVASNLLSLEFKNLVKSLPGKKFTLL